MPIWAAIWDWVSLLEEAELDDLTLALVERLEADGEQRVLLDLLVAELLLPEPVGEAVARVLAERSRERPRRVGVRRVEGVDHVFFLRAGRLSQLLDRRRAPELGRELVEDAREPQPELLEAPRDVHRPGPVSEVAPDLAHDRRHRVARELDAAVDVEAVDRFDQADHADLHEIL